jgi:peptide/nickel transport system substrate-binding protein
MTRSKLIAVLGAVAGIVLAASTPALAQKSKDNLRIPLKFPIDFISYSYSGNINETQFSTMAVYDTVVMFDEETKRFVPGLAKSWKQVDPTTIEFELRDDVKWHDGNPLVPEDVVDTLMWFVNPDAKLTNAGNWEWIEKAEKTGPHTVRLKTKRPTPHALARLTAGSDIWPAHVTAKLADRKDFGRAPVGTGPYRATQVDSNAGIVLMKNSDYKMAGPGKPLGKIGRVHLLPIPDPGTQMAQLLSDGVDAIKEPEVTQVPDLLKDPRFTSFVDQRISYVYMAIDAMGAAGNKALTDVRVRKALFLALDRNDTTKMSAGDDPIPPVPNMCWKGIQQGCDYTVELPKQDVAQAKKLLAEAGYPNGFEIEISCYTGTRYTRISTVVAEQFRQVGLQPKINCVPAGTYLKLKRENKIQLVLAGFPAGSMADAAGVLNLFADPQRLDFHGDQEIFGWAQEFGAELNTDKRLEIGRKIFNAYTERAYVLPVAPIPTQFVHRKELKISGGTIQTPGVQVGDFSWN